MLTFMLTFNYGYRSGEHASVETKRVRANNERLYGDGGSFSAVRNVSGRKVDLLVAVDDAEVASCEWKAPCAVTTLAHEQETKNMRTNACLCNSLASLLCVDDCRVIYMDWIGKDFMPN